MKPTVGHIRHRTGNRKESLGDDSRSAIRSRKAASPRSQLTRSLS